MFDVFSILMQLLTYILNFTTLFNKTPKSIYIFSHNINKMEKFRQLWMKLDEKQKHESCIIAVMVVLTYI